MNTEGITARAQTLVRRPRNDVFDAFVNPATMSRFWFTRRDSGLVEGQTVRWYLGIDDDAPGFDVTVLSLHRPSTIVVEWGEERARTQVTWTFDETDDGDTILRIEEAGFTGSDGDVVANALDSTGGFNQVIIAVKALLEYDADVNVVRDHVVP